MAQKTLSLFDLSPGKTLLERYRIVRPFRHGGMSTTFEVEDSAGGDRAELQLFPAGLFERASQGGEFAEAMRSWGRVRSPRVVATRDVHVLEDGTTLVVTDLPTGISLRDWQKEHGVTGAVQTVEFGAKLLEGLETIHAAGLVHGDIKPHTIHVDAKARPSPLLVDGGITPALWSAKHLGDKTTLIGTPFYAPIEQFGGDAPTVQSDVYNVATVLYELLTGVVPWKGKSFLEVFQAKLEKRPPPMKTRAPKVDVPQALEDAIAGGLMADRNLRYASAADFKKRLAAAR